MRLTKLKLKNFRCFSDIEMSLDPKLTVLVAENGQGKTTVLDAIRVALWPYLNGFDLAHTGYNDPANSITIDDARIITRDLKMSRQLPVEVSIDLIWEEGRPERTITRYRDSEKPGTKTKDNDWAKKLKERGAQLDTRIRLLDRTTDLLMLGYYGTGRLWDQKKLTKGKKAPKDSSDSKDFYSPTFAYRDCMDPASSFKHFEEWYRWTFKSFLEYRLEGLEKGQSMSVPVHIHGPVVAVQQAIDAVMKEVTGWHTLEYRESMQKSLVMRHDQHGFLKADQLSDGIRIMLGLVGDIAHRCVKLNPHLGAWAPVRTKGIVLIDEVDMHLHPRWQQVVLQCLQDAFPEIQFIVTTHSPQVLSTVKREHIRVLGTDQTGNAIAQSPLAMTYGEPSGDVMRSVMLVDPQPPVAEKNDLLRLTELVDQGLYNTNEAGRLLAQLTSTLGDQHPQLQRLQRSIQRQEALK